MTRAAQKASSSRVRQGRLPLQRLGARQPQARPTTPLQDGIQGFVRTLGIELGPFGVNANAIAPASSPPT
jgi:3-oxoacyl-[acyl-carrier protein] reductase